jgi:hypothetical protein
MFSCTEPLRSRVESCSGDASSAGSATATWKLVVASREEGMAIAGAKMGMGMSMSTWTMVRK